MAELGEGVRALTSTAWLQSVYSMKHSRASLVRREAVSRVEMVSWDSGKLNGRVEGRPSSNRRLANYISSIMIGKIGRGLIAYGAGSYKK